MKKRITKPTKNLQAFFRGQDLGYEQALRDVEEIIDKYTFDKESHEWAYVRVWILKEKIKLLKIFGMEEKKSAKLE